MERDEISLLEEEFVQLSVKTSLVGPTNKLTLLCYVWTRKTYKPIVFGSVKKHLEDEKEV